jgi:hypothetical protein
MTLTCYPTHGSSGIDQIEYLDENWFPLFHPSSSLFSRLSTKLQQQSAARTCLGNQLNTFCIFHLEATIEENQQKMTSA